jgi:hypothetical protein
MKHVEITNRTIFFEVMLENDLFVFRGMFQLPYRMVAVTHLDVPQANQINHKENACASRIIADVPVRIREREKH